MNKPSIRRVLRSVLPWIIVEPPRPSPRLFDGDDRLFVRAVGAANVYGEYGCGLSTLWVANNSTLPILSVDTSRQWIDKVMQEAGPSANRIRIEYIDVGDLASWGRPLSFAKRQNFRAYFLSPWVKDMRPDLVLIDGRFRVACFLTSLLHAAPGSAIVFDDYRDRPHYHIVEEFVIPAETFGRQALFVVPEELPRAQIQELIGKFEYVFD